MCLVLHPTRISNCGSLQLTRPHDDVEIALQANDAQCSKGPGSEGKMLGRRVQRFDVLSLTAAANEF